jgi:protein-S-isoprenylcysteine O-methyltransferase Ste14
MPWQLQLSFVLAGGGVFFASLALYIWGLRSLGSNFNASSSFGVRLHQAHKLVTHGPYAYIRHPMYMAVILACWGGLLLYRTWTMLFFVVIMLGLLYRAHNEEKALEQAFGEAWEDYKCRVPGWIPRRVNLRHQYIP